MVSVVALEDGLERCEVRVHALLGGADGERAGDRRDPVETDHGVKFDAWDARRRNVAKEVATPWRNCPTLRHRDAEGPAVQGLPMRRRGLEPPPGYPGPGPQPGNPSVISVQCVHIVQIVQPRGRYARNGRSGCCHGCCHEGPPGAGGRRFKCCLPDSWSRGSARCAAGFLVSSTAATTSRCARSRPKGGVLRPRRSGCARTGGGAPHRGRRSRTVRSGEPSGRAGRRPPRRTSSR